jgi:fibronectin-binding autotransporter adhesin
MQRQCVFVAAILLAICAVNSARATTYDWNNTAGGFYSTTTNWNPIGIPTSSDTARFSLANTYTVTLNTSTAVNTLTQTQGDVTLNLNNSTYSASSTTNNALGAAGLTSTLRITSGTLGNFLPSGLSIGSVANSTSNLYLDTGSATTVGFGSFNVGNSGTGNLWVQNGATLINQVTTGVGINTGSVGTATVSGTNSAWTINNIPLRVGSSGTGTLNILAGGAVNAFALEVGENLASNGTISMSGLGATLTVNTTGTGPGVGIANIGGALAASSAASATLNLGTGAVMNLNGTTNFRTNAKVNMNGGRLNLNIVNFATGATVNWSSGQINFATAPTVTPSILDILLGGTHTLSTNRTLSATAGTLTLTTPLTVTGGAISAPTIDLNANMDIGAFSNISATNTITLEPGNTIQLGDFATLAATTSVTNNGGTLILQGPLANVTGPMANNGGFVSGTGRFVGGLNNGAAGTIRAEAGDHLIIDTVGPTNLGTIELAGGTVEYSKTLSNLAGGTISGRGVFRGSSSAPGGAGLSNLGVVSLSAGISDVYGDVNNGATGKIVAAGASTITFYDNVVNNGDIRTVLGSRTVFFGGVSGAGTFSGGGTTEFEGDLKPGNSPANVTFGGNVVIGPTAGTVIELAGTTKGAQYDSLTIAGNVSLGGALDVVLLNGFVPSPGQSFNILTSAGGIDGSFDSMDLPALAGGLYFNLAYTSTAINLTVAGVLGDYNKNGIIDASDYILWRKTISQSGNALAADGNNNGIIDPADFTVWRNSYGAQAGSGAGTNVSASIPEPTSLLLFLVAWPALALSVRSDNRRG